MDKRNLTVVYAPSDAVAIARQLMREERTRMQQARRYGKALRHAWRAQRMVTSAGSEFASTDG